MSGIKKKTS